MAYPLLALLWRAAQPAPLFFALSGDDLHRTLYAWEVTQGNWVPSTLWPPLQFWVTALALRLYPDLLVVPMLVNLAAATGTLAALAWLCRTLGLGRWATLLALLLTATLPWFLWLSLSGLAEPLFFLGVATAYGGVAAWRKQCAPPATPRTPGVRDRALWLAVAGLAWANLVRFDAWGHAVPFTLGVLWLWLRHPSPRPHSWPAAAALPWLGPLWWLADQTWRFGDPFHFAQVVRTYWQLLHPNMALTLAGRLFWQPRDLALLAGWTLVAALAGWLALRRRPGAWLLAAMWLGGLALLIAGTLRYTIPSHNEIRLVVIHALLLQPAAAAAMEALSRRRRRLGLAAALLLLAAVLPARWHNLSAYPRAIQPDVALVSRYMAARLDDGLLAPGEQVMVEVQFWEYLYFQLLMQTPERVRFDRPPQMVILPDGTRTLDDEANPSLLALPPAELAAALRRQQVRLVIIYSERAAANLAPVADELLHAGRYRVYRLP